MDSNIENKFFGTDLENEGMYTVLHIKGFIIYIPLRMIFYVNALFIQCRWYEISRSILVDGYVW